MTKAYCSCIFYYPFSTLNADCKQMQACIDYLILVNNCLLIVRMIHFPLKPIGIKWKKKKLVVKILKNITKRPIS